MANDLGSLVQQLNKILEWLPSLQYRVPLIDDSTCPRYPDGRVPLSGAARLAESIRKEICVIERLLNNASSTGKPPSINASHYITVWNTICTATSPIVSINASFSAKECQEPVRVDVVADGGRQWIRINSTKPSKLSAELNELAGSDSEESDIEHLTSDTLDSTVPIPLLMKCALQLRTAAACNPYDSDSQFTPKVTLLLSRIPSNDHNSNDPRRSRFLSRLLTTGVDVMFSESLPHPNWALPPPYHQVPPLRPTSAIALDCSFLLALTSDVTHTNLPKVTNDFKSPANGVGLDDSTDEQDEADVPHIQALKAQVTHELARPMLSIILSRTKDRQPSSSPTFFTTPEAITHMFSVVMKVGGVNERRRALALADNNHEQFWKGSRYSSDQFQLFPLLRYPSSNQLAEAGSSSNSHTTTLIQTAMKRGHTILTSNKKSVYSAIRAQEHHGYPNYDDEGAAFWLVEPRSLAECLRDPHGLTSS